MTFQSYYPLRLSFDVVSRSGAFQDRNNSLDAAALISSYFKLLSHTTAWGCSSLRGHFSMYMTWRPLSVKSFFIELWICFGGRITLACLVCSPFQAYFPYSPWKRRLSTALRAAGLMLMKVPAFGLGPLHLLESKTRRSFWVWRSWFSYAVSKHGLTF